MIYVAVGFKITQSGSLFYFRDTDLERFLSELKKNIEKHDPDFVSLRMVKP